MKVKDLIKQFREEDMDKEVIMFSDEEGNNYSDNIRVEEVDWNKVCLSPYNQKSSDDL